MGDYPIVSPPPGTDQLARDGAMALAQEEGGAYNSASSPGRIAKPAVAPLQRKADML